MDVPYNFRAAGAETKLWCAHRFSGCIDIAHCHLESKWSEFFCSSEMMSTQHFFDVSAVASAWFVWLWLVPNIFWLAATYTYNIYMASTFMKSRATWNEQP